jgi:rfaE bifunctional protein nucleotidyltransferase chain/domain
VSCYPLVVSGKVKSLDELKSITVQARRNGKTVVFTNGCFDLLHRGHVHVLREAKALGDILVVAINSDGSVKAIKGPNRPVLPESDRAELVAAMEMVDYVALFDEPDPYKMIAAIRPNVLVKGGDWGPEEIVGADIVKQDGGKVAVIPYLKGFSTTEIIERIRG